MHVHEAHTLTGPSVNTETAITTITFKNAPVYEVSCPIDGVDDPRRVVGQDTSLPSRHGFLANETKSKNDRLQLLPLLPTISTSPLPWLPSLL